MTQLPTSRHDTTPVCLCEAHHAAYDALDDGRTLDAVVWVSTHLAVSYRLLHRQATRFGHLGDVLVRQRRIDRRLEQAARLLERRQSGDGAVAGLDLRRLQRDLRAALDAHVEAEQQLLQALHDAWPAEHADEMCRAYAGLLAHSPTRPHPHLPRSGTAGRVAYRLAAWRDHVLDTLDGRRIRVQAP